MENNPVKRSAELEAAIDRIRDFLKANDGGDYNKWHELIDELVQLAEAENMEAYQREQLQHELAQLPSVAGKRIDELDFALDKINTNWNNFVQATPDGQLKFEFDTTQGAEKGNALVLFSLDFLQELITNTIVNDKIFDKTILNICILSASMVPSAPVLNT